MRRLGLRSISSYVRKHQLTLIWSDGKVKQEQGTSKELMVLFGVAARDVRLFGTKGAHLSIRPDYFMFRLPPFTGCVWSDNVMVLNEGGQAADLFRRCLAAELEVAKPIPFEFRVLETALRESFVEKKDRFTRLSALVEGALKLRSEARTETQLHLRDFLAPSLSRVTQEHALYKLLMLSNSLSALEVDVKRQELCLEGVLKNDEDMAAMYLSHRRDCGRDRQVSEHQDVELLLESFAMQLEDLRDRIQKLLESVETQSKMEQLMLTSERNRIMRLELLMGMGTSSLAVSTVIAGFFGMNLQIGLEELPGLFWVVMTGSTVFSLAFFQVLLGGVRRYHSLQRKHLDEVQSLRQALDSLGEAYYEVRQKSNLSLSEEDAGVSKMELVEALQRAGCRLTPQEQDVLWEAMDTNQDGRLSPSELGLDRR